MEAVRKLKQEHADDNDDANVSGDHGGTSSVRVPTSETHNTILNIAQSITMKWKRVGNGKRNTLTLK